MNYNFLSDIFSNFTEDMYNGNTPAYYNEYQTGQGAHYQTFFGTLDLTPEGQIWAANITFGDKNNTIYIIGDKVELMHIPYDGIPHYWMWCNEAMAKAKCLDSKGFYNHGKDCLPKYPKDYIQRLLKKKRPDRDNSFVWQTVTKRFTDEFIQTEGDFY